MHRPIWSSAVTHSASEFELLSEIHFANVVIFQYFFGRPRGDQTAITEYIGSVQQIPRVSRTLWSVIRTPMSRSHRWRMMR